MAALSDEVEDKMNALNINETTAEEDAAAKKREKKKRNKANKKKAADGGAADDDVEDAEPAMSDALGGKLTAEQLIKTLQEANMSKTAKNKKEIQPHKFWDTQPVPREGEVVADVGPLVHQTLDDIRKEPYPMAPGMEWSVVDILDPAQSEEVYNLLTENYVEDDDAMFRFDYSIPFLHWALTPPGFLPEWHLGVRSEKSGKLMAFISGVPAKMRVQKKKVDMVEINFLCVHKKLRSKRLAPVLIKEITRRVNVTGVYQAVYTAGVVLPGPVAECRYWHRSLNPKKLIDIGFSRIAERSTLARTIKLFKLPEWPKTVGMQPLQPKHVQSACKLLNDYLSKQCVMAPVFNEAEFGHTLLPRAGVVDSFVVVDEKTNKVTDLCSFYHLPSSVMKHPKHKKLNAAYSFYNVATTVPLKQLLGDLLIQAKRCDMDVFNALDLMENGEHFTDLKFGIGDGHLQYYLFNYKLPKLKSHEVGLVLL